MLFGWSTGFELCPTRYLGFSCPGCGLGRATLALFLGDVVAAHRLHPLVIPCLGLFTWLYLWAGAQLLNLSFTERIDPRERIPKPVWIGMAGLLLALWIARYAGWFGLPAVPI